jgi:nucleoside-diphosphate-sugar epimerase
MMKVLFIGGTGLISSACAELAIERGHELFILNRSVSNTYTVPAGAQLLTGDVHGDPSALTRLLGGHRFDAIVDFIAFTPEDIERDIPLFSGRTDQFVFISSASAYQKPPAHYVITEDTPLVNPYWEYSRNKIACEERLMREYREKGFPVTIVRPSLTYGPSQIPLCVGTWQHPFTEVDRARRGKKLIVPGDGTSLWVVTWNGDFAVGMLGLLGRSDVLGHAFTITSDEVLTWNQIYDDFFEAVGITPNIVHVPSEFIAKFWLHAAQSLIGDKMHSVVFDNAKIKRYVPEFNCRVRWAEGVRCALSWFEAERARQTVDEESDRLWDKIISAYESAFPKK